MRKIFLFLSLLIGMTACNTYEQVLKNKDIAYRLEKGNEYYDKGYWYEATKIYESVMPALRGSKGYESLYYRYAYAFYNDKDYINAAYQFKNFTEFFSKSNSAEEMQYMHALSLFKHSKKYTLEQVETEQAIGAFQKFSSLYPESKYTDSTIYYLEKATERIETKEEAAAKLYLNLDEYKASAAAYKALIFDFPDSRKLDYYYFMVVKTLYLYADNSFERKQKERFQDVIAYYDNLKTYYPNSKYTREGATMYAQAQNKLNALKDVESK